MKATRRICIFTDSQYCKYIFQGTGERYERDGFMKAGEEVPNKDMIKTALSYIRAFEIAILKVRAHTGAADTHSSYNEMADQLANKGAYMKSGDGIKSGKPATLIQSLMAGDGEMEIKPLPLPFPKKSSSLATASAAAGGVDFDNSYRYNDKSDWREEEKKKFANKTKLTEVMYAFTDEDGPDEEAIAIGPTSGKKPSAPPKKSSVSTKAPPPASSTKPKKFTNVPLSNFLQFGGDDSAPSTGKKSASSAKSISSFFTDDD